MKRAFLVLLSLILLFPIGLAACTGGSDQLIFRISAPTNGQGELWNGASNYPVELCYDALFGFPYSGASPHTCTGGNSLLWLSSTTNGHADSTGFYTEPVCYGELSCTFRGSVGNPQPCNTGETCILTVSDRSNAHLSSSCSGAGSYDIKLCCPPGYSNTGLFIEPYTIEVGDSLARAELVVANTGSNPVTASVVVRMLDPLTHAPEKVAYTISLPLAPNSQQALDLTAWVDAPNLAVNNYLIVAEVYDSTGTTLESADSAVLEVIPPGATPVPELFPALLPAIGLAVVLAIYLSFRGNARPKK